MVKAIKLICIAGILALLILFVLYTGDGRSAKQERTDKKVYKEGTTGFRVKSENYADSAKQPIAAINN